MCSISDAGTGYTADSYDSRRIPNQPPQTRRQTGMLSMPLPWGKTHDVAPFIVLDHDSPRRLREIEEEERKRPGTRERNEAKFHNACSHICYRRAHASAWTHIWVYLGSFGKGISIIWSALIFFGFFFLLPVDEVPWHEQLKVSFEMWLWVAPAALASWVIAYVAVYHLPPDWIFKPSKGPLWELNRQTGMVTVFARKPGQFKQYGIDGDFVRPFYEFDAYLYTVPDRQGMPWYSLHLIHRYHSVGIDFKPMLGMPRNGEECFALWDMWQNYMDISRPLPDIPTWEEFRPLDPVTAEHDRATGRHPRHWRDMDDAAFKQALDQMGQRVRALKTLSRPNLMAKHVLYL